MISFEQLQRLSRYQIRQVEDDQIGSAVLFLSGIENNTPIGVNSAVRFYAAYRDNDGIVYIDYDAVGSLL